MFKPLADRVLIRREATEEKTSAGLIIPTNNKDKPPVGTIVSVGSGSVNEYGVLIPVSLSPGDKVMFGKYSGTEIKINDESLLIMKESDILGVL